MRDTLAYRVGKWLLGDKVLAVGVKGVGSSIEAVARAVVQTRNGRDVPCWVVFTSRLACVLARAASSFPYSHVVRTSDAHVEAFPVLRRVFYLFLKGMFSGATTLYAEAVGNPVRALVVCDQFLGEAHGLGVLMCVARHDFVFR
jgi:hypothetical protein